MKTLFYSLFLLQLTLFLNCQTASSSKSKTQEMLEKSCAWLWSKQQADGGWHSETHGILKGGESLTAFILWHLLEVDDAVFPKSKTQIEKGLQFLRNHISKTGIVGIADPDIVDYPNYSTAYALRIFYKYGNDSDQILIKKMTEYLLSQQFTEQRGFSPADLAYGAWGFGETNLQDGKTGHVDLSHTRRILQTLRMVGLANEIPFEKAQLFLNLLQKQPSDYRVKNNANHSNSIPYDGGFYASSVTTSTNKAMLDSLGFYPSYATATADGLLALLAAGNTEIEAPVKDATQWLQTHSNLYRPEGIPTNDAYQWHKVMFFYHLSVRAEVMNELENTKVWKEEMVKILAEKQQEDGHFVNPVGSLNKEDDPLLATTFAIIGLNACLD